MSEIHGQVHSDMALDFGPFNGVVGTTVQVDGALGSGSAHQTSTIGSQLISINGGCAANGEGWDFDGYGSGSGSSSFACDFTISEAASFTLTGCIDAYDDGESQMILTGPGTDINLFAYNSEEILDESGELQPGTYLLQIEARSSAYGDYSYYGYAYGGFNLEFALEAPSPAINWNEELGLTVGPNPFAARTRISYSTPGHQSSSLEVFDLRGRRVQRFSTTTAEAGVLAWDGSDSAGRDLAPGMYFLVLRSGDQVRREKLMLIK